MRRAGVPSSVGFEWPTQVMDYCVPSLKWPAGRNQLRLRGH
jgi:hypothetical protein